jgi:hypothetical protein
MSADFGNPMLDTVYHLCLETAAGMHVETIPAGLGWSTTRSGHLYKSRATAVRKIVAKSNSHQTSLSASLRPSAAFSLPLATPVRFRIIHRTGSASTCYESIFANPELNTDSKFRASE